MFGRGKKITVGAPTGVQQSTTGKFATSVASSTLDAKTKGFLLAALSSVGNASHGKVYNSAEFHNWEQGNADMFIPGHEKGLNCWTAVLFWAFQGGGITKQDLTRYASELKACANDDPGLMNSAQNAVMYSMLRANQVTDISVDDHPPAGVVVFFGDTTWKRPMNHVVASLGGGYVVSCASLFMAVKPRVVDQTAALNPTIPYKDLTAGLNHISTIKLIADSDPTPRIRVTSKPFWQLSRLQWADPV